MSEPVSERKREPKMLVLAAVALVLVGAFALAVKFGRSLALAQSKPKPPVTKPVTGSQGETPVPATWKEVDRLVEEQKFEAAAAVATAIREKAAARRDDEEWTRALVKEVQLRTGLHGYETAVRFLKEQPWPRSERSLDVLSLFYAQSLVTYCRAYSWEINQREKVDTKGVVDLKAWTRDELFAEAQKSLMEVYGHRENLGHEPVKALAEYLDANTYPEGVRPTLRDTVTYLFAGLLDDTSFWTPKQSNELFALEVGALLAHGAPASWWERGAEGKDPLSDPATHPLVKVCALLGDLEAWHAGRGDREAALEARLERLRVLHGHFTREEDRARVRKDLAERLPAFRSVPWYAMGLAVLAGFTEQESAPDALVRARALAVEGYKAHPGSPGGQCCDAIRGRIEAPSFDLESMGFDAPSKRSIRIRHKNLGSLALRAVPFDLLERIGRAQDYNLLPHWDEAKKLLSQSPAASWTVDLPGTPDYRTHDTYVTPPALPPGLYLVGASARPDFQREKNRIEAVAMTVSDIVMVRRDDGDGGHEVTVLYGASGQPAGGVEVLLYRYDWQKGHKVVDRRTTGADGRAAFVRGDNSNSHFLVARKGPHLAFDESYLGFYRPSSPSEVSASLIYTDRSIYRPGQKLYWKVLAYRGRPDQGRYQATAGTSVTVTLYDLNNNQAAQATVSTNGYGTASGEFTIPPGRPLGGWRLQSSPNGVSSVRVEEYKRPTFEVAFKDPASPLRLNRPASLTGEAKYYFGLPVVNGAATWRVRRVPVYPWWWGWYYGGGSSREQTVASGISPLKEDGTFEVAFTPSADEREAKSGVSYSYAVSADITDEGGETRTANRSFRLGFVSVEARVSAESGFFREGEKAQLSVSRADLNGTPRPGKGSWRLVALQQPSVALLPADQPILEAPAGEGPKPLRTPGDGLRPRWAPDYSVQRILRSWEDGVERGRGALDHDAKGVGAIDLPALPAGAYRVRYETTDEFDALCSTQFEFVVAAKNTPLNLPFFLAAEVSSVTVGGTARFLVHSGVVGQPLTFERYRAGKLLDRKVLAAGRDGSVLEVPVTEEDRGGFAVRLSLLSDYQFVTESETVFVPWDDRQLQVEFSTFRDKLRPGGTETWRVAVKTPGGKAAEAGAAELLAYMYDKSLDLFAPHHPPSALSLYPSRSGIGGLQVSLRQAPQVYSDEYSWYTYASCPSFQEDRLHFYDNYGIGGPGYRGGRYRQGGVVGGLMAEGAMPPPAPAAAPMMNMAAKSEMAADEKKDQASNEAPREEESDAASSPPPPGGEVQLRSNFAETAFWQPHLLTDKDGTALVEFTVPDSVTSWNVWVHAVTKDLKAGSLRKETRSVKDLMVRPYVPRFFREGDKADLKVVVNNASDHELNGQVTLEIFDPETKENLAPAFGLPAAVPPQAFTVKAGGGADLTFSLAAPARVGTVAFQVVARAGDLSDGELRPLPVLPGRMHLVQSRFVTLRQDERRELTFEDLAKSDDPSRINEQMVVTVDGQLFYGLLEALPYLVNYPYECTEQTLNRFLSTGILSSLYDQYPSVAKMAQDFSKRETPLETWDQADPNRKMALEESPWLVSARGGQDAGYGVEKVLDPRVARAQRDASLAKLLKAQTSLGAWPWWAGGPPSPYMTLYIVHGFSKAAEFGVDIPKEPVVRAFEYLHRHYLDECVKEMMAEDTGWEFVTFLNYVLSNFPDESWTGGVFTAAERKQMLDFSFSHWKRHSPYLKGYLTLTLKRMSRGADAKLVWDSVMDSAKTTRDEGTSWAPEDRGWLWYNDSVETHAFAVRTLMELDKQDRRTDGLVQWIYLNKKLNHWESTKATAEVLYSIAYYLRESGALGTREAVEVVMGPVKTTFTFEPDVYTGKKNQVVVPGEKVDGRTMSTIQVSKQGKGFAFASATWHFSTEKLPEKGRGDLFQIERTYYRRVKLGDQVTLQPLTDGAKLEVGDELEVQLSLSAKHPAEYVHLRDPRPAGCEPVSLNSGYRWDLGLARYEEVRDSGNNFFMEWMPQGQYTLKYRLRCSMAGTFRVSPATLQSMYAPEFNAYSAGHVVKIAGQGK